MSTKLSNTDHYNVSPDRLVELQGSADFINAKYTAMGDRAFSIKQQDAGDGTLTLVVEREVAANMPDVAKKVLGETNNMVLTENWRKSGDGWQADVTIDSPGKPMAINGSYDVKPAGDGADWVVNFDIKASVPLVGGKVEKMVAEETKSNFAKEYEFISNYLAG